MAVKKPNVDPAHEETEKILSDCEKRIKKEYEKAVTELQGTIDDYFRRFELKDKKWREWVADGTKTAEEYKQWRIGQMAVGDRWKSLQNTIATDLANTEMIAKSIAKGYMPEVYAVNFNYGTYEVEHLGGVDTGFTLYNREAVERIVRENPDILPSPGKKVSQAIAEGKAVRWNKQVVQSTMIQGILQGESIPKLAKRLAKDVADKDYKASIRNARTMATSTQNAGRYDAYRRAEEKGIEIDVLWRATLDNRTRHSHRQLDGQRRPLDEPFEVDGFKILYPGQLKQNEETDFPQSMIWNCRCTLRGIVKGLEPRAIKFRDMSAINNDYEAWKKGKSVSEPITAQAEKGEAIAESYRRKYRKK